MKRLLLLSLVSFAFCFAQGQALQLLHPASGDVWPAFSTQRIQWQFANVDNIKIEVSVDSARSWTVLQSSYPASATYYDWTVVNKPSDSCFVRITDVANPSVQSSNYPGSPFKIPKPALQIDNVDASVYGRTALPISWTSAGVQTIRLLASYNNGLSYSVIADNIPASAGYYNWIVTNTTATNCFIVIQSADTYSLSDTTGQLFSIKQLPGATAVKYHGGSYDGHSSATNKQKSVQVVTPNTKVQLTPNTTFPITWNSTSVNQVNIKYSIDSGATWLSIATGVTATVFIYNWTVPATPSAKCLVKIADASDSTVFDVSDSVFIIKANMLKFSAPALNDVYYRGQVMPISWTSQGLSKVNITYLDGSVLKTIQSGVTAANEVYNWIVPTGIPDSIGLKISDNDNPSLTDTISKLFIRTSPSVSAMKYHGGSYDGHSSATNKDAFLTLIKPNGSITIASAIPYNITWVSSGVNSVDIALSVDSGHTWKNIVSAYSNTGSYVWTVPGTASAKCLIKISNSADSTLNDVSDSVFTILAKSITLTSDTAAIRYYGTVLPLEWTQTGIEKVSLQYKTSSRGSWQKIKDSLPSASEVFNWTLPALASDSLYVRIFDTEDSSTNDQQLFAGVFKALPSASATKYQGGSFDGHAYRSTNNKINILKPAANDTLISGSTYPISWIAGNVTDSVTLQYTLDSGITWNNIANISAVTGQYQWSVPSAGGKANSKAAAIASDILSNKCIIRAVSINSVNEIVGISSKTFSIEQSNSFPPSYYWVGGTGLWSDYAHHWATTSGGTTFHSQPPSSVNNVFFDANSFNSTGQTVTVDVEAACRNMNWSGATHKPNLVVPSSLKLTVYGSIAN